LTGSPCPVAVAPRGYADREHFGLGVIAVAFDGTAEAKLALHEARRLALKLGAVVRLVGVVPPVHDVPARIGHTAPGYARALEAHFREARDGRRPASSASSRWRPCSSTAIRRPRSRRREWRSISW
jgi:hypothetical protein